KPCAEDEDVLEQKLQTDDLLLDLDDLIQEIEESQERAHEYEERYDRYGGGGWGDEDSLGPYEEVVEPLGALFDRTDGVFDSGDMKLARAAYDKLFSVFNLQDDYGRGVSASDLQTLDFSQTSARYLRAVYETEPLEERPRVLFEL